MLVPKDYMQLAIMTMATLSVAILTVVLIAPFNGFPGLVTSVQKHHICPPSAEFSMVGSFNPNDDLERTEEEEASDNKTWEALLLPPGGRAGKILAQNDGAEEAWGISMFHQLHCLIAIRGIVFPRTSHNHGNSTSLPKLSDHWAHCFDYIAQMIICAADDTLERPVHMVKNGKVSYGVDGIGFAHQCRDSRLLWEVAMDSLEENVDFSHWRNGDTVHSFFRQKIGQANYDLPEAYRQMMQTPLKGT